jgi:Tol biopolymer transport system component
MSPQHIIAHYRITSKLGRGGMGEVWRATDTKLGREVAIKVLPDTFAADPDRLARFAREAQMLAALNHPNIAAIYGLEQRALVMELVDGPTLAERIAQGPIPLDEALAIARQITEALEAAHEKGIVHRDLKPANIKLTADGRVKVLDFGLAKAMSGDSASSGDPVNSPTLTIQGTVAGVVLGTAGYMAPEQAKGRNADRRADIWAFGVVLYEMLTGGTLFVGETISDTLAAVLTKEPDIERTPARVHRLLRACLEKDPKRRLRDIGDAFRLLEEPSGAVRRGGAFPWLVTIAVALAAVPVAVVHFRETPESPAAPVRFNVNPPPNHAFGNWLALSPDGRHLAFPASGADGVTRLSVRALDSVETRTLAGTEGANTTDVFWSPDSRILVFQQGTKIRKIDIAGGSSGILCDAPTTMLGGSWNADGIILFGDNTGAIQRVSSAGGIATSITRVESSRGDTFQSDPVFLPDGRHFLYFRHAAKPENQGVYVGSLDSKPEEQSLNRILPVEFSEGYAPPRPGSSIGRILFVREETLMAQPFDQRSMQLVGDPVPIAEQVGTVLSRGFFSVSPTGVLAYRGGAGAVLQLVWYDRQGKVLGRPGEPADYLDVALSPDNSRLAYSRSTQSAGRQIWIFDLARGIQSRFTFESQGARSPVWSPDGRYLAFASQSGKDFYLKDVNAAGNAVPVYPGHASIMDSWSPDGRFLVFNQPTNRYDLLALPDPLGSTRQQPVVIADSTFSEMHGQVSPDSRFIAYTSNESGLSEVYVRPFPPGDGRTGKWLVSANGGMQPRWRGDGKELFYLDPGHTLMAVDVSLQPGFQVGTPHPLFTSPAISGNQTLYQYDAARDGSRFLMIGPLEGTVSAPATIVLNWETGLKK